MIVDEQHNVRSWLV